MQNNSQLETAEQQVARPLKELARLIKADLQKINDIRMESIRTVSELMQPLRVAIGEKLLEAKPQVKHGSFKQWIAKTLPMMSYRAAAEYMSLADTQKCTGVHFSNMQHFRRHTKPGYKHNRTGTANWRNEVQSRLDNFNVNQFTKHDDRDRLGEQIMVKKLAGEIVSIGYKVLATKMHPDKGGSAEAMQRLNEARDMLKEALRGVYA
jgi:hypothetical protein